MDTAEPGELLALKVAAALKAELICFFFFNESLMVKFPFFLSKPPLCLSGCSLKECKCAGECTGSIFTILFFFCLIRHLFKKSLSLSFVL